MAKDLPTRDLQAIANAARRRFCPLKRLNDLTDSERDSLFKLYGIFKNKWTKIAEKLNCYSKCVETHVSYHLNKNGKPFNTGKWSSQEKSILIEGLKIYFNTNDLSKHIFDKNIEYRIILEIIDINR